jgi:hypothetical protein
MDISSYIQDLLWDYECVIIPGFGGILATYRSAEIVHAEHTIYPPSKTLAFNEYLTTNDGLLANHIARKAQISYTDATDRIQQWVKQTTQLLKSNEEIYLPGIGRFHRDVERNLQFVAEANVNYLASAYGLRKVVAAPLLRDKSTDTIHTIEQHRASYALPKPANRMAMAAAVILFLAIATVLNLLYQGVNFKPLNLNTSSVLGFIERIDHEPEVMAEPKVSPQRDALPLIKSEANQAPETDATTETASASVSDNSITENTTQEPSPTMVNEVPQGRSSVKGRKYYVMIGAYQKSENLANAQARLQERFPNAERYEDTSHDALMRIGFYAANNYREAFAKLQEARKDDSTYWLLVR